MPLAKPAVILMTACFATAPRPALPADESVTITTSEVKSDWTPAPDEYYSGGTETTERARTDAAQVTELPGPVRPVDVDGVGKSAPSELATRMGLLILGRDAGADTVVSHPEMVQETLKMIADVPTMWNLGPSQRVSCWLAVDETLRRLKPQELVPLRDLQERSGGALVRQLSPSSDAQDVMHLFQRYPRAASMHELLVAFGENALREGKWSQAHWAFQSALAYSTVPLVIAQARVGLWLTIASASDAGQEALVESMSELPGDALLPWRGSNVPAVEVKHALLVPDPTVTPSTPEPAQVRHLKLRLPPSLAADEPVPLGLLPAPRALGPWPICRVEISGQLLFVIGTGHVACYNANDLSLRWVKAGDPSLDTVLTAPASIDSGDGWPEPAWRPVSMGTAWSRATMVPGGGPEDLVTASPKVLYSLLRYNLRQGILADVAAFDTLTGQMLWHTRDQTEWVGLEPISEPAASEGLVYLTACSADGGPACQIYLVGLDGVTGKMVWKKLLGKAPVEGELRELMRLGSAVTVFQEAVYVSANVGLVARCNARDGTVEWVRTYASAIQNSRLAAQFRREGTSPLVSTERVIVAPRDHCGVLALSRATGSLLWETGPMPSDQIIGSAGTGLLLRGRDGLAALDVATGKEIWSRSLDMEANGSRALIVGTDVVVVSREKLLRVSADSGKTREEMRCAPRAGCDQLLLPDGTLAEISQEAAPGPVGTMESGTGAPVVPVTNDWTYACVNPLLVIPPADEGPKNTFGILSGRTFASVTTTPRCAVAWQALLRDGVDSVGFQGQRVIVARGHLLTALDVASGAIAWTCRLPFESRLVAGDDRLIVTSDLTADGKVVALDAGTGALLWRRRFSKDTRLAGGQPVWISMRRPPAYKPTLLLYVKNASLGKEGPRPAEVEIDALSGVIRDVRPFLGDEPGWPERIAFVDHARTYTRRQPFLFPTHRLGFRRDEVALLDKESRIRLFPCGPGPELAPDWKRALDLQQEGKYAGALAMGTTAAGMYVKQLNNIFFYDPTAKREITCTLPREAGERAPCLLLELWEASNTVMAVSAEPPPPPSSDDRLYTFGGLKDDTGAGDVTIRFFEFGGAAAQIGIPAAGQGFPEACTSPVATLLNGLASEFYHENRMSMSNLNSLGWTKYDVFVYGVSAIGSPPPSWVKLDNKERQTCEGWDFKNPTHRTTFVQGVNYVKFTELTNDAFALESVPGSFSGIQIVDASAGTNTGRKAASLGISWNGGPGGLGPNDRVGAEVAGGYWYVISPDRQNDLYSKTHISGGYQAPHVYLDVFDRNTGGLLQTQKVPIAPRDRRLRGYGNQAAILDDALVVADQLGVKVLRTIPSGLPQ
jgi:outer membrane protein assembly factor BamB